MSRQKDTVHADASRLLDERGNTAALAPNGLNPATVMEKAVRERIVDSYYYKEQCWALNEADIVDRVVDHVRFVGGTYGATQKPAPFLCLAFKLLELAPSDDVLAAYLGHGGERFKYLRALAAFYVRITRQPKDVYLTLEPLLADRRKLRRRNRTGVSLTYVDEFVDDLLVRDRLCATSLMKLPKRELLEDLDVLEPRVSPLGDLDDILNEEEGGEASEGGEGSEEEGDREPSNKRDRNLERENGHSSDEDGAVAAESHGKNKGPEDRDSSDEEGDADSSDEGRDKGNDRDSSDGGRDRGKSDENPGPRDGNQNDEHGGLEHGEERERRRGRGTGPEMDVDVDERAGDGSP